MNGYKVPVIKIMVGSYYSEEEFGDWYENMETSLEGWAAPETKHPDVVTELSFEKGDTAYIVWAVWSYGDTFGECNNCQHDVFGMFTSPKVAQELVDHLDNHNESMLHHPYGVDGEWFETSDGQKHLIPDMLEWEGYFETLTLLEVAEVVVK